MNERRSLILDTDFESDCDDVGALAVLHALADEGLCDIRAVMASTSGSSIVGAIDAVNTFSGRPGIPIGLPAAPKSGGFDDYAPVLADPALFPGKKTNNDAEDAVRLYRRILADSPDHGVSIVVIGFLTNLSNLLDSGPDYGGDGIPLRGEDLIAAKVSELTVMGGHFTDPDYAEFNILHDIPAVGNVADHWPVAIVFSGYEIGLNTLSGANLTRADINPITKAYEQSGCAGPKGEIGNRHSWDQTAVYYAVRGTDHETQGALWTLSQPGRVRFDSSGRTRFEAASGGKHRYLIQKAPKESVGQVIEAYMLCAGNFYTPPHF